MSARLIVEMSQVGLGAIWGNKLRSFLAILGNVVAVGSIVTLVSLIQGITVEVKNIILTNVGADTFMIEQRGLITSFFDEDRTRKNPRITLDDLRALERFGRGFKATMASTSRSGEIRYQDNVLENAQIRGVTEEFSEFQQFDAERGRLPTPTEVQRRRHVALLGWSTADRLFATTNPLEQTITVQRVHFRVVGVSASKGSLMGQSQDEFVVIPLGAFQQLFGVRTELDLMVMVDDPNEIDRAMDEATVALRIKRRLRPAEENNFGIFTADTALDLYNLATTGIYAVLVGVVGLSLVVAGIVIMNIMLMAVFERTREIGLRKALGACRRDIMWQMLSESVALSTIGGVFGTSLGVGAAVLIDRLAPVPATVHIWSVVLAISLTAGVGLFFGLYPASRAAALDPIDALGRTG